MRLIAHRGNVSAPEPDKENTTTFIERSLADGYDAEVDIWRIEGELFLGHDAPENLVNLGWLLQWQGNLWVHTKNLQALDFLIGYGLRVFYHQQDKHTVIGNTQLIWSHDVSEATERSIIPLLGMEDIEKYKDLNMKFYGICSDYVWRFK